MSIFEKNVAYRPFKYPWAVEAEKVHRIDMNWHENQIDLQDDLRQYNSKNELATKDVSHKDNKFLLDKLLLLFTEMDVCVAGGYSKLLPYVENNEIKTMWLTFACREVTHQRAYALAAETFGFSNSDWSMFKEYKEMQDKVDLLSQDIGDLSNKLNFCKMLSVVLLGEGIALFGAFACLLNLRRFGKLMNFNSVNDWSLTDEDDHVSRNIQVLREATKELSEEEVNELFAFIRETISRYVMAEHKFIDLLFEKSDQQDLTKEQMKEFINYLGDLRAYQTGANSFPPEKDNPLEWIDYLLSGSKHTNFFENRVADYSHDKLQGETDYEKFKSKLEDRLLGGI